MIVVGIPIHKQITVRKVDQPGRRLIARFSERWRGDRYGIVLCRGVHEATTPVGNAGNRGRGYMLTLETGAHNDAPVVWDREDKFQGIAGELTNGEALVMFRRNLHAMSTRAAEDLADVTFMIPSDRVTDESTRVWFSADDRVNAQLAVARDAILAGECEWQRALEITREVMPKTHALVLALFRRERNLMMETA